MKTISTRSTLSDRRIRRRRHQIDSAFMEERIHLALERPDIERVAAGSNATDHALQRVGPSSGAVGESVGDQSSAIARENHIAPDVGARGGPLLRRAVRPSNAILLEVKRGQRLG